MPYALCPMPYALYALCPMPYALCPMPYALCPTVPHFSEKGYNLHWLASRLKFSEQDSINPGLW